MSGDSCIVLNFSKFVFSLLIFIFLPSSASACWVGESPTDSSETFTVKIVDTYFKIPESYVLRYYERLPDEKKALRIQFKLDNKDYAVVLAKYDPSDNFLGKGTPINQVAVVNADGSGAVNPKVWSHINALASKTPPETWEYDFTLTRKLGLSGKPCMEDEKEEIRKEKSVSPLTYEELRVATDHRNIEIRRKAASMLGSSLFREYGGAKDLLLGALQDESYQVRSSAIHALGSFLKEDPAILGVIKKTMIEDDNVHVRRVASSVLNQFQKERQ